MCRINMLPYVLGYCVFTLTRVDQCSCHSIVLCGMWFNQVAHLHLHARALFVVCVPWAHHLTVGGLKVPLLLAWVCGRLALTLV
jgi:hypothetical protein